MSQVLTVGRNCWDITAVDQTGLLIDGCDYYRAFHNVSRTARRYILICGWQFDSDVCLLRGGDEKGDDVRLLSFFDAVQKLRDGMIFFLQKETDCFFLVLPHPKRGEQSVGRDHDGATPGFSDTRIGTDDQRFDWRTERSGGSDSRSDPG